MSLFEEWHSWTVNYEPKFCYPADMFKDSYTIIYTRNSYTIIYLLGQSMTWNFIVYKSLRNKLTERPFLQCKARVGEQV